MLRGLRAAELLRFLLVASIVGPSIIFVVLAWFTYQAAVADAEREIIRTSEVAREHAAKVFDSFRLVTERVEDALDGLDDAQIRSAEARLHQKFLGFIEDLPQIQSFVVLDGQAHPLVATAAFPAPASADFSDRDYVKALKGDVSQAYISKVQLSRISGKLFFGWGRARRTAEGGFGGVIDIAISPDVFMQFYRTLVSEAGASLDSRVVTMIRDDGQILVRYPGFDGPPALVPPESPFFKAVHQTPDGGLYTNRSVVDPGAPERLFSFRKVPGHPIYNRGRPVARHDRGRLAAQHGALSGGRAPGDGGLVPADAADGARRRARRGRPGQGPQRDGAARTGRGPVTPSPEDGGRRPADRRHRP